MKLKLPRMHVRIIIVLVVLYATSFLVIAQAPVHRTDIDHSDPLGDSIDSDVDIIRLRSYREGQNVVLEMTVDGQIKANTSTQWPFYDYRYEFTIVTKGAYDGSSGTWHCAYRDGELAYYDFGTEVDTDTLRIYFPLSTFFGDSFMIGLEGLADGPGLADDFTDHDRDGEVARILFRIW